MCSKSAFLSRSSVILALLLGIPAIAQSQSDVFKTSNGDLRITPIHHASVMLEFGGKVIYVDPVGPQEYFRLPKADLILITDIHQDHFNEPTIRLLRRAGTILVTPAAVAKTLPDAQILRNGEKKTVLGIELDAVPMYNLSRDPKRGTVFHEKGRGNGYVLVAGGKRIYVSGDTECTPEVKNLKDIDIAFVCMNPPYTMPPSEAAECVRAFKPKIVYPYHFRGSNTRDFTDALKQTGVEVRIRKWY